jgi:hypothetical protein
MKTLYEGILDDIKEGLLSDMETTIERGNKDAEYFRTQGFVKQNLFSKNLELRKKAIEILRNLVLQHNSGMALRLPHIKNSDKVFVEFYDGYYGADKTPAISVKFGKRIGSNWIWFDVPVVIANDANHSSNKFHCSVGGWNILQHNISPKNNPVYFAGPELDDMFSYLMDTNNLPKA